MKSRATPSFWKQYNCLPRHVQEIADRAYLLWRDNPSHPSLQFKRIHAEAPLYSARVGRSYRAVGVMVDDTLVWYWIGTHSEYDHLLKEG